MKSRIFLRCFSCFTPIVFKSSSLRVKKVSKLIWKFFCLRFIITKYCSCYLLSLKNKSQPRKIQFVQNSPYAQSRIHICVGDSSKTRYPSFFSFIAVTPVPMTFKNSNRVLIFRLVDQKPNYLLDKFQITTFKERWMWIIRFHDRTEVRRMQKSVFHWRETVTVIWKTLLRHQKLKVLRHVCNVWRVWHH